MINLSKYTDPKTGIRQYLHNPIRYPSPNERVHTYIAEDMVIDNRIDRVELFHFRISVELL